MELLLLLTALLASLTGSGSGDQRLRQVQGVAVVHAAQAAQAAVQPSRAVSRPIQPMRDARTAPAAHPLAKTAALAGQHFPFERRLE